MGLKLPRTDIWIDWRNNIFLAAKSMMSIRSFLVFVLVILFLFTAQARVSISPFTNPNYCGTSYPTAWFTSSFSISELTNNGNFGFRKSQTNRTLILGFSNSNFNFNPGIGSVTASGTEVTINAYTITSTSVIVNITVSSSNKELNTISFNNFQVRASAAGSSMIRRTGGTFSIDNSTGKPASSVSWGNLTASTPFYYSTNTSVQSATTDVFVNSSGNLIIRTQVVIAGSCGASLAATAFHFNTAGSGAATQNPTANIAAAKLYYTGTSTVFATSSLFGSVTAPNGSFTINGSQAFLTAGTYNFWLTYDIASTAIHGDLVDAQFVSVDVSGNNNVAVSGNPAGSRTINSKVFYTRDAGNWSNTTSKWSVLPGGTACACTPAAGSAVYISHSTVLDVNSPVLKQVNIESGGVLSDANMNLNVSDVLNTSGSGRFQASNSWTLNNVATSGSGQSTSSRSLVITGDLSVGAGSSIQFTGGAGQDLTVNGNLFVDGTLALGTSNASSSNTLGVSIGGTGSVTGSGTFTLGVAKIFSSETNLTISPALFIGAGVIVTNYGGVSMENNINGGSSTSRWVNEVGSVLNMNGVSSSLLSTGILDASAESNIVSYGGSGAQSLKIALNSNYYHLHLGNAGVKTLGAAIMVSGNINISGTAQFASGAADVSLLGNWINNSSHATPYSSSGTLYFAGSNDTIQGSGITTFHHINIQSDALMTGNSAGGKVIIAGNWVNDGDFDHNQSDIIFNGTTLVDGLSITVFNSVIVNAGRTLTLHSVETDFQGNITSNGTFSHNSALALFSGNASTQVLSAGSGSLTFYRLELDNPAGQMSLSCPVVINNLLTLTNGRISSSASNILSLIAGASATSGTSTAFVNGPMEKTGSTAFVFPVGKGSRWARIAIGAPSSSSTFRAEYFDTPYANTTSTASTPTPVLNNVSQIEYWQLDRTAGTGNAVVTLHWEDAASSGINDCSTNDLRIAHWNGSAWENNNESVTTGGSCTGATPGFISTSAQVTSFSPFTFGSKTSGTVNVLPVDLLDFSASCRDAETHLTWRTAAERQNAFFLLERSADGELWSDIATIPAGKPGANQYSHRDHNAGSGNAYYRLVQVDHDGARRTFNTVHASCEDRSSETINIFPNPATSNITVGLKLLSAYGAAVLEISDYSGRICLEAPLTLVKGSNVFSVPLALSPGAYLLRIRSDKAVLPVQKLLVE